MGLLEKIFGSYSDKEIKRIEPIVSKIESYASEYEKYSDEELKNKTNEFKERYAKGETLDDLLPEAYANVREAGKRALSMYHFRVQLIGGIILHQGRIAEMRTGEGKTLVSTLPAYLNALSGNGVHIVTVNDYLAKRDSEWMGKIHEFLGLTVGVVLNDMSPEERREAYACDITYATNNELGFDYLRDNMVVYKEKMVQRGLNYAVIDEVDSVLIDEARTPLIISGAGDKSTKLYEVADSFVKTLIKGRILNEDEAMNPLLRTSIEEEGDFVHDEKAKSVSLTGEGISKAEKFFSVENLSDPDNISLQHHISNALKANYSMHRDKDYVVQENEIIIVDEFTGRLMAGRRYSDGLHQAIEAKEKVDVQKESKTLATITFQNYFNKYSKKSGMTGTALTEESEFREIYGMDVVAIPTNRPIQRKDHPDIVFRNENGKLNAIVKDVQASHEIGQPVLVGTITIEKSEELSLKLKRSGIPHKVLNAKYHEKEAEIVSEAGHKGAVTIATNMAGRGTDIKLEEGVADLGGLKIIGTERHESRRIDNQLRGRSGRQGDPGESRFYLSLEDDLLRLFGAEKVMKMVDALGLQEDEPIETKILSNSIETAQKRVEGNNFSIRKHLLDYDLVNNEQREVIYGERMKVLTGESMKDDVMNMLSEVAKRIVDIYTADIEYPEEWDLASLNEYLMPTFHEPTVVMSDKEIEKLTRDDVYNLIYNKGLELYNKKEEEITPEKMREVERIVLLKIIDNRWMTHIDDMEKMRQGISLRSYAQKDPVTEYKFLSYDMFEELSNGIQEDVVKALLNVRVQAPPQQREAVENRENMTTNKSQETKRTPKKVVKISANAPCPCGSGKKFKQCHGQILVQQAMAKHVAQQKNTQ
ncbi:MAG: preprotein translocase subunit SecA [Lachnospirales bacterium]